MSGQEQQHAGGGDGNVNSLTASNAGDIPHHTEYPIDPDGLPLPPSTHDFSDATHLATAGIEVETIPPLPLSADIIHPQDHHDPHQPHDPDNVYPGLPPGVNVNDLEMEMSMDQAIRRAFQGLENPQESMEGALAMQQEQEQEQEHEHGQAQGDARQTDQTDQNLFDSFAMGVGVGNGLGGEEMRRHGHGHGHEMAMDTEHEVDQELDNADDEDGNDDEGENENDPSTSHLHSHFQHPSTSRTAGGRNDPRIPRLDPNQLPLHILQAQQQQHLQQQQGDVLDPNYDSDLSPAPPITGSKRKAKAPANGPGAASKRKKTVKLKVPKNNAGGPSSSRRSAQGQRQSSASGLGEGEGDLGAETAAEGEGEGEGERDADGRVWTEDEIRKKQSRSRASGRVLPRGNACEFCKRRKLRCDGQRPTCTNCQKKRSGSDCEYVVKEKKDPMRRMQDRIAELEQRLSMAPLSMSLEAPLHPTLDLLPSTETNLEMVPNPLADNNNNNAEQAANRNFEGDLANLELPGMDIDGAEHADGFNSLFEQTAAAAAAEAEEEGGEGGEGNVSMRHEGDAGQDIQNPERHEGPGEASGSAALPHADSQTTPQAQPGTGTGTATDQESYLITLANAAEVAGDAPQSGNDAHPQGSGGPRIGRRRPGRPFNNPPEETVWSAIWKDLKDDMQAMPQIDDRAGGVIVSDCLNVFYKRADAFLYTRSLHRLHEALISPVRPQKCLVFAILATVCIFRPFDTASDVVDFARALGPVFLNAAQRDFVKAITQPEKLLDGIQTAVLLAQIWYAQGKVTEGYLIISQALRLAVMAGLHRYKPSEFIQEDVVEHIEGPSGPEMITSRKRRQVQAYSPIPWHTVVPAPEESGELGERIHLFWTCLLVERTACLALSAPSSVNDDDILLPWPRNIFEYAEENFAPEQHSAAGPDWPEPGSDAPEPSGENWLTLTLKGFSLMVAAQKYYGKAISHVTIATEQERNFIVDALESYKASLPKDAFDIPVPLRKRTVPRHIIWSTLACKLISNILLFTADAAEHMEAIADNCDFVWRMSRAVTLRDRPKLDIPIVILMYITVQHLKGIGDIAWNQGKLAHSKACHATGAKVKESIRVLGRSLPLALSYANSL